MYTAMQDQAAFNILLDFHSLPIKKIISSDGCFEDDQICMLLTLFGDSVEEFESDVTLTEVVLDVLEHCPFLNKFCLLLSELDCTQMKQFILVCPAVTELHINCEDRPDLDFLLDIIDACHDQVKRLTLTEGAMNDQALFIAFLEICPWLDYLEVFGSSYDRIAGHLVLPDGIFVHTTVFEVKQIAELCPHVTKLHVEMFSNREIVTVLIDKFAATLTDVSVVVLNAGLSQHPRKLLRKMPLLTRLYMCDVDVDEKDFYGMGLCFPHLQSLTIKINHSMSLSVTSKCLRNLFTRCLQLEEIELDTTRPEDIGFSALERMVDNKLPMKAIKFHTLPRARDIEKYYSLAKLERSCLPIPRVIAVKTAELTFN